MHSWAAWGLAGAAAAVWLWGLYGILATLRDVARQRHRGLAADTRAANRRFMAYVLIEAGGVFFGLPFLLVALGDPLPNPLATMLGATGGIGVLTGGVLLASRARQ